MLDETEHNLKPSQVVADLYRAIHICRDTQRLTPIGYVVDIDGEGDSYFAQFEACAKLAKATKVVSLTVPSAELGSPFNGEVERLRELVRIAGVEGVLVSIKTEVGRFTEDPATAMSLCQNVKGLGITLDPSHYICNPHGEVDYDQLLPMVYHVQLRDSKRDRFQVRVGQGEIEYGRLTTQLARFNYNRGLVVQIVPDNETDHDTELRKLRLLLESLV